ncbi:MAG TPA: FAD-dependent oxidoreductase [Candidatus Blautia merdigallinarum]|uniref:FAD-dependent oxidoreductase n=1 Tax=Candidatus Blautia merdigallinarum TaxID=2838495 RepID=A0A9D2N5Q1_9FIRM|nr:FAD-dependent oxidoreductase [Candidatus Blautia merdigallinarum]
MEYVILGAGAAGITAAKTIRKADKNGKITVISTDTQVHSRCMLHKYLSHERDAAGISFVDPDFFEKNQITWLQGKTVNRLDTQEKKVYTDQGDEVSYDRLLIATGAESFIPPVGNLRDAENVFGLRHLRDAQAIDELAKNAENIVIIGSGLVGLDAAYGLMETGKKVSIVEMADQILPVQLDKTAAFEYQKRFEEAGARFYLGRKAADTIMGEDKNIHEIVLDNGEKLACDLIIVAAGVRSAVAGMEGEGIVIDRGIKVDDYLQTGAEGVYAAGDVTGLSGIWPNAQKQGETAALNMCGSHVEYADRYAIKNTINFFGLVSMCVGVILPQEGDVVIAREDSRNYKRVVLRDGKVAGVLFQGDISHGGIWQYLIKNQISISGIQKDIFDLNFGDFYEIKDNGEYQWRMKAISR